MAKVASMPLVAPLVKSFPTLDGPIHVPPRCFISTKYDHFWTHNGGVPFEFHAPQDAVLRWTWKQRKHPGSEPSSMVTPVAPLGPLAWTPTRQMSSVLEKNV